MTDHPWLFEPLKCSSKLTFCQFMMGVIIGLFIMAVSIGIMMGVIIGLFMVAVTIGIMAYATCLYFEEFAVIKRVNDWILVHIFHRRLFVIR